MESALTIGISSYVRRRPRVLSRKESVTSSFQRGEPADARRTKYHMPSMVPDIVATIARSHRTALIRTLQFEL
jgi:hypothetical protein